MIGGIIGDVVGSVYEAYQWQRKDLPLFQDLPIQINENIKFLFKNHNKWKRLKYCWTDDTLCTLALYHAYVYNNDPTASLVYFCKKYMSESIGFGGNFTKWLDNPVSYQSFANGSIMRIGFIPYLNLPLSEQLSLSERYTNISHDHIDSLNAVNEFITLCYSIRHTGKTIEDKKSFLLQLLNKHNYNKNVELLHLEAKFEMNALQTLLQACSIVNESYSYEDVLRNSFYVGGDCDTLACVASNIASHIFCVPNELKSFSLKTIEPYDDLYHLVLHFLEHYN